MRRHSVQARIASLVVLGLVLIGTLCGFVLLHQSDSFVLTPDEAHSANAVVKVKGEAPERRQGGIFYLDVLVHRARWRSPGSPGSRTPRRWCRPRSSCRRAAASTTSSVRPARHPRLQEQGRRRRAARARPQGHRRRRRGRPSRASTRWPVGGLRRGMVIVGCGGSHASARSSSCGKLAAAAQERRDREAAVLDGEKRRTIEAKLTTGPQAPGRPLIGVAAAGASPRRSPPAEAQDPDRHRQPRRAVAPAWRSPSRCRLAHRPRLHPMAGGSRSPARSSLDGTRRDHRRDEAEGDGGARRSGARAPGRAAGGTSRRPSAGAGKVPVVGGQDVRRSAAGDPRFHALTSKPGAVSGDRESPQFAARSVLGGPGVESPAATKVAASPRADRPVRPMDQRRDHLRGLLFRRELLCALRLDEPCPTFRPASASGPSSRRAQAPLLALVAHAAREPRGLAVRAPLERCRSARLQSAA